MMSPTYGLPAYSSPPSRKSSSASNASNTTTSSSLASPPESDRSPPKAWELKAALDRVELASHRSTLGEPQDEDGSGAGYFSSWKAPDEPAFELAIPSPRFEGCSNESDFTPPARRRSSGGLAPAQQQQAPDATAAAAAAAAAPSPSTSSSSSSSPSPSSSSISPDSSERLPHLHLLPRPSLTPAQRKYSSSLKTATLNLLSLSLNAAASPSATALEDGCMMQSPEGMDSPIVDSGMPWEQQPRRSFGQAADDGEFALSAMTSPASPPPAPVRKGSSLSTKTSYAELRAQAEERANALQALRRDSDISPLPESACVLEDSSSSSGLSDSDSDAAPTAATVPYTIPLGRKASVRRRSGWRTSSRHSSGGPSLAPAFAEESEDDDGGSHLEFTSSRHR